MREHIKLPNKSSVKPQEIKQPLDVIVDDKLSPPHIFNGPVVNICPVVSQ